MGALIGLQNFQRQQAQLDALARAAPDLAKTLGMTPDMVIAAGPQAIEAALKASAPTDAIKDYTQAKRILQGQGLSERDINQIMPPETLAMGGSTDPLYRDYVVARSQWQTDPANQGKPLPPELAGYAAFQAKKAGEVKLATDRAQDLSEAQQKFPR